MDEGKVEAILALVPTKVKMNQKAITWGDAGSVEIVAAESLALP